MLRMGGVTDAIEVCGIAWRTAYVFRWTATGGLEQEGKFLCRRVVESHVSSSIPWSPAIATRCATLCAILSL